MRSRTLAAYGTALAWAIAPTSASAVAVPTVEIENPTVIDATAGTDLTLTSTGDIYVYIPAGFFYDEATITGFQVIIEDGVSFDVNAPLICDAGCVLESYDLAGDVVLNVLDPLGTGERHVRRHDRVLAPADPRARDRAPPRRRTRPAGRLSERVGMESKNVFKSVSYRESGRQVKGVNLEGP